MTSSLSEGAEIPGPCVAADESSRQTLAVEVVRSPIPKHLTRRSVGHHDQRKNVGLTERRADDVDPSRRPQDDLDRLWVRDQDVPYVRGEIDHYRLLESKFQLIGIRIATDDPQISNMLVDFERGLGCKDL